MGEHTAQHNNGRSWLDRKRPKKATPEVIGRKLLEVIVYGKSCRIGARLDLDDLAVTSEIGDWKMADFKLACSYAASQGWLSVDGDKLTLTTAGYASA